MIESCLSTSVSLEVLVPIFDEIGLGVLLLDSTGRVQAVNRAAEAMLGAPHIDLSKCREKGANPRFVDGTRFTVDEFFGRLGTGRTRRPPPDVQFRDRRGQLMRAQVLVIPRTMPRSGHPDLAAVVLVQPVTDPAPRAATTEERLNDVLGRLEFALTEIDGLRTVPGPVRDLPDSFRVLTARESEILTHLLTGARVSTISQRLYLSQHTVRNHLRSIFRKVGVSSQAELIQLARGPE